MLEDGRIERNT